MTHRIRLTDAQVSAIECRMDGDEQVDGLVMVDGYLIVEDAETTYCALRDASNAEDDAAEYGYVTGESAKMARRAARSLHAVAGKVLKLQYAA